jgi:hypothetical protein
LHFSYTLNAAIAVTFTVKRESSGRKVKGVCAKRTRKNNKHRKCVRLVELHGKIVQRGYAGANGFTFNGKIGGHRLSPGTYQLTATPTGGKPRLTTFTIAP